MRGVHDPRGPLPKPTYSFKLMKLRKDAWRFVQSPYHIINMCVVGSFSFPLFFNEQNEVVTLSNTHSPKGKEGGGWVKSLCFLMNGLYTKK